MKVARRNVGLFLAKRPALAKIVIVQGDALRYELPPGPVVIFLYNPFDGALTSQLIARIEASLRAHPRDLYVICYNPVYAALFDGSAALERRAAMHVDYGPEEIGYGPDEADSVVIWQNRGNAHPAPAGNADAPVAVTSPGWRAVVQA